MIYPDLAADLAHERERALRANAAMARLAAIANCCRPSRLRRGMQGLRAQLQRHSATACCA